MRQAVDRRVPRHEVAGQHRDVGRPLAQRRQVQVDHVQPEPEIFAEAAGSNLGLEVAIAGREQADVDLDRRRAAQPIDLALLDGAQQLGLQARDASR